MTPSKLDLTIWRGTTFELELVTQVKKYTFDPAIHNNPADLKRTHAENLAHYGFVYEYVDFAALYEEAILEVYRPWRNNSPATDRVAILTMDSNNGIELTNTSVKLGIDSGSTNLIGFDSGTYELRLITPAGKTDGLIQGEFLVKGAKSFHAVYDSITFQGAKLLFGGKPITW